MATISNIYIPLYNLVKGVDYHMGYEIAPDGAQEHAKKLLIELFKTSSAVAGFFAVCAVSSLMATPISAYVVATLTLGSAYLITLRFSTILNDATKITAGLVLIKMGCVDLALKPLIHTIKMTMRYMITTLPQGSINIGSIALSALKSFGIGYSRFIPGVLSVVRGVLWILEDSRKDQFDGDDVRQYSDAHLIDRWIDYSARKAAPLVTRICGYSAP